MPLLDELLTSALTLGPHGRFVLPILGTLVGLTAFAVGWILVGQRVAWSARELARGLRTQIHTAELGERVWIVGRLRAPGKQTIASFARSEQRVVVSSLHERVGKSAECIATRTAPGLAIETRSGLVPITGLVDVRRTRATRVAANVDARSLERAGDVSSLRAADVIEGQWVLAHGSVERVARERLRESAAVLGLSGGSEMHPDAASRAIVLTALRPEVPAWTGTVAVLGALALALVLTPIPWPGGRALFQPTMREVRVLVRAVRLLGPTRSETLATAFVDSSEDLREREWATLAAIERGDCRQARWLLWLARRDEEALAQIHARGCTSAAEELQLLRETGRAEEAYALMYDVVLTERERRALTAEAGYARIVGEVTTDAGRLAPAEGDLVCDAFCLDTIRGHGDAAFDLAAEASPARRDRALDCSSEEVRRLLWEIGLVCGQFTPAEGREAVRLAPRSMELRPLSAVEARLHVIRTVLLNAGAEDEALVIEGRQRRLLAILATEHGARAEEVWTVGAPIPEPFDPRAGCMPITDLAFAQEQAGMTREDRDAWERHWDAPL